MGKSVEGRVIWGELLQAASLGFIVLPFIFVLTYMPSEEVSKPCITIPEDTTQIIFCRDRLEQGYYGTCEPFEHIFLREDNEKQ